MYLWCLLGNDVLRPLDLQGITRDPAKAMRDAEPYLKEGRAFLGVIAEVVPRISVAGLDIIYVPSGRQWLGRRTIHGGVRWTPILVPVDPSVVYRVAEGQWAGVAADLSR